MSPAESLFVGDDTWLDQLPTYQREIVNQLLALGSTEEEAAAHWLTADTQGVAPFGGEARSRSIFFRKFIDEIHDFLCSDSRYGKEREEILKQFSLGQATTVSGVAAALSGPLSAAGPLLAPAVALVLVTVGKMGLNAWCATVQEERAVTGDPQEPA